MYLLRARSPLTVSVCRLVAASPSLDHYAILGVKPEASAKEIKAAYYQLSKQHHPDTNPENKEEAARKFHEVSQAYEILGSDEQRRLYDMTRIRTHASSSERRRAGPSRDKQYTDIDIDYKSFEQFQRNTRRRRQFHSHFEMPDEFYAEFGGKKRVFKSEYEEATEQVHTMYKDSRAAQREQEEIQREIQREQERLQKKYPIPTFEQLMQEKRQKEASEQKKYLAGLLSVSCLGMLLFLLQK